MLFGLRFFNSKGKEVRLFQIVDDGLLRLKSGKKTWSGHPQEPWEVFEAPLSHALAYETREEAELVARNLSR